MEQQELLDRIKSYFEQPIQKTDAHLEELNLLYFHVTGVMLDCKPCQYVERRKELKFYQAFPRKPYILNQTLTIKPMAAKNLKYRLTDPKIAVTARLGRKQDFKNITPETLTDAYAEEMLANPTYAHLVEPNPNYKEEESEEAPNPRNKKSKNDSE